jgi:hypothetical protein
LSGTTTAARPFTSSSVVTCWTKFSCLVRRACPEVVSDDRERLPLRLTLAVHERGASPISARGSPRRRSRLRASSPRA